MLFGAAYYNFFIREPAGILLALVTATVGSFALYLYRRQSQDEKRTAAQTIFGEISSAENKLKPIRERFFATATPSVEPIEIMKFESWSRYKHLFLKDLKADGMWDLVDNFYSNCADYDTAVKLSRDNLQSVIKENYRHQYEFYAQKVLEAHKANPSAAKLTKAQVKELDIWQQLFLDNDSRGAFEYFPAQAGNVARQSLVALDSSVTASEAGKILKRIARL